jgi:hypothetical protein
MMIPDRCCIGPANGFLISSPLRRPPTALQEPRAVGFASRQRTPPAPLDGKHGLAPPDAQPKTAKHRSRPRPASGHLQRLVGRPEGREWQRRQHRKSTDRDRMLPAHQLAPHGLARELPSRTHWQALDADHQPPHLTGPGRPRRVADGGRILAERVFAPGLGRAVALGVSGGEGRRHGRTWVDTSAWERAGSGRLSASAHSA